jgi:hypothetical protein
MRRRRADLEEKREPRAATSTRQKQSEDGAYGETDHHHLTMAAIEKPPLEGLCGVPKSCRSFSRIEAVEQGHLVDCPSLTYLRASAAARPESGAELRAY